VGRGPPPEAEPPQHESMSRRATLAVVVIGRNEGARLSRCLRSISPRADAVVYLDGGSSDGSPDHAREPGATVVELDRSLPFTAARARNAGFERARGDLPDIDFVQFVNGDCEFEPSWLEPASVMRAGDLQDAAVLRLARW
jgi:glycosyltransferase involved in cell wall biosynthesis